MYEGSAARRLDAYEEAYAPRSSQAQPSFGVVEGAGLDAQARKGVSAQFIAALKYAGMAFALISVICVARIFVFSAAASVLTSNLTMRAELKDVQANCSELRIERSVLSNSDRIERIATQAYGMVLADGSETLTIGDAAAAAEAAAEAEAAEAAAQAEAEAKAAEEEAKAAEEQKAQEEAEKKAALEEAVSSSSMNKGDGSTAGANAADVDSL